LDFPNKWYQRADGLRLGRVQFDPYIESLPNGAFRQAFVRYSCLRWSVPMWKGLSLEREIVRYSSVSLSLILSRNEIVEQHIRKKTHKPNALRFWVEGGVIPLCGFWLSSHSCEISPALPPWISPTPWYLDFLSTPSTLVSFQPK